MAQNAYDKARSKMFPEFGPSPTVAIAKPAAQGRMTAQEREELERRLEEERNERKLEEAREVLDRGGDSQEGKEAEVGGRPQAAAAVQEEPAVVEDAGKPREKFVLMNFRIEESYRKRIKMAAAASGRTVLELFKAVMDTVLEQEGY